MRWPRLSLSSLNPTPLLLSFGSIRPSVLSVSCRSMRCCLVSASRSSPVLSFFALHPFSPPSHRSLSFPSIPSSSSPRSSFQVLGLEGLGAPVTAQGVRRAKVGSAQKSITNAHTHLNKQNPNWPFLLLQFQLCLVCYLHMSLPSPDPEAYLNTQPRKH